MRDTNKSKDYWDTALARRDSHLVRDRAVIGDDDADVSIKHRRTALFIRNAVKQCLSLYSAGEAIESIAPLGVEAVAEVYPWYVREFPPMAPFFDCATRPSYTKMHRYFALLALSRPSDAQKARFVRAYDTWDFEIDPDTGERDRIWEAYALRWTNDATRPEPTGLNWPAAYQPLWEAVAPGTHDGSRAVHLQRFVEGWYKTMATEIEADTDLLGPEVTPGAYVGYWCIEAAAAAVTWGIDDTALRDHPHYPTEWADWAR